MKLTPASLRFTGLAVICLVGSKVSLGAVCAAPTGEAKHRVMSYVHDRYQVPAATALTLESDSQANAACFWKMSYRVGNTTRKIVVYLTPDGGFITPAVYDLSSDPLAEAKETAKLLETSLAPLTAARLGAATSPVTIVEFSDFECPYCKQTADTIEHDVLTNEKNKASLAFRNFPLPMHPWAKLAAEMGECARIQKPDAFWSLHDYFFKNQSRITLDTLRAGIKDTVLQSGIDGSVFDACVSREQALDPVTQDVLLGQKIGVHGTPTLFVNGVLYNGPRDSTSLSQMIEAAAAGKTWQQFQSDSSVIATVPDANAASVANECRPQTTKARKAPLEDVNAIDPH